MTKLEKLYSIIENSREVGVKLTKEVLQQVEELEEEIIKEEILPALSSDIAPRLEPIRRDLVLVVEYHPGEPISVALSRKAKISEIMGAKTLIPRNSTPVKNEEKPEATETHEATKHVENTTKGLKVTIRSGFNLVGKEKRPPKAGSIWQHECDGWYIYSNMSNATKIEYLKTISDYYKLGLIIEEGKPV